MRSTSTFFGYIYALFGYLDLAGEVRPFQRKASRGMVEDPARAKETPFAAFWNL
jgi:hypothetical protein